MTTRELPYGSWPSPITPIELAMAQGEDANPVSDAGYAYQLLTRPDSGARVVLVRHDPRAGTTTDVSPDWMSVRSRIHEYGGGAFAVRDGVVLAVDLASQRLWRLHGPRGPRALTPVTEGATLRWSAMEIDAERGVCWVVREDSRDAGLEPVNELVRLDLDAEGEGTVVVAGRRRALPRPPADDAGEAGQPDFVIDPVLSPDRRRLAWVQWSHPAMPWQAASVLVGDLDAAGDVTSARRVGGGDGFTATEPVWVDDHRLAFLADPGGFAVPHVVDLRQDPPTAVPLTDLASEFGLPAWQPRRRAMTRLAGGRLAAVRFVDGVARLCVLDPEVPGEVRDVDLAVTAAYGLAAHADGLLCEAGFADLGSATVLVDVDAGERTVLATRGTAPDPAWTPAPETVTWPGHDGVAAHGFLYLPTHPEVAGPEEQRPPLMVKAHGGPTGATSPTPKRDIAYFTSRGIAVLDVNYAGSTGYGRAYRQRLDGLWGVADIEDCVRGAQHLADTGVVDGARLGVRGGSAGGYVVLAALAFHDVFTAGTSLFGISDLSLLAKETHKLESRYPDGLVGPWPAAAATYDARSPLHHLGGLRCPLLLLQGTEDRVVPPSQAEQLADALRAKGLPVALELFEGEGHGFREIASVVRAWELETSFLAQVWGYDTADDPERARVENL